MIAARPRKREPSKPDGSLSVLRMGTGEYRNRKTRSRLIYKRLRVELLGGFGPPTSSLPMTRSTD